MSPAEKSILDKEIRGISTRTAWQVIAGMVVCTGTICATALGVYNDSKLQIQAVKNQQEKQAEMMKGQQDIINMQFKYLELRIEKLENKK